MHHSLPATRTPAFSDPQQNAPALACAPHLHLQLPQPLLVSSRAPSKASFVLSHPIIANRLCAASSPPLIPSARYLSLYLPGSATSGTKLATYLICQSIRTPERNESILRPRPRTTFPFLTFAIAFTAAGSTLRYSIASPIPFRYLGVF